MTETVIAAAHAIERTPAFRKGYHPTEPPGANTHPAALEFARAALGATPQRAPRTDATEATTAHDLALRIQQAWDKQFSKPMDSGSRGLDYQMALLAAETVLEGAEPHMLHIHADHDRRIAAVQRERDAQLAGQVHATYTDMQKPGVAIGDGRYTHPFGDLLRKEAQP